MHSLALPERLFGRPWNKDSPPADCGDWGTYSGTKTVQEAFEATDGGGFARARMTSRDGSFSWTRAVTLAALRDDLPVIVIQDSYASDGAKGAKIFTLNLMAEGAVQTPAGPVAPEPRIWGYEERHGDRKELPSAGRVFALKPGVQRLGFTGQSWPAHPSKGIDFDVHVIADAAQEAFVGNWAHAWSGGWAGRFRDANGRPFEERQHILRIRGEGFRIVLVPQIGRAHV